MASARWAQVAHVALRRPREQRTEAIVGHLGCHHRDRLVLQADRARKRRAPRPSPDRAARIRRRAAASHARRAAPTASICPPPNGRTSAARARRARRTRHGAAASAAQPSAICRFIPISAASSPIDERQRRGVGQGHIAAHRHRRAQPAPPRPLGLEPHGEVGDAIAQRWIAGIEPRQRVDRRAPRRPPPGSRPARRAR